MRFKHETSFREWMRGCPICFLASLLLCVSVLFSCQERTMLNQHPNIIKVDQYKTNAVDNPGTYQLDFVTQPEKKLRNGQRLVWQFEANKAGFLYIYFIDSCGEIGILYPKNIAKDNNITANQIMRLPPSNAIWKMVAREPYGDMRLIVVLSERQQDMLTPYFNSTGSNSVHLNLEEGKSQHNWIMHVSDHEILSETPSNHMGACAQK